MAFPGYHNSLLITQFREFYAELARLKAIAMDPVTVIPQTGQDELHEQVVQVHDIWQKLLSLLEAQAERASRSGGAFGFEVYREAQYMMAALADEFFLNENWQGRASWPLLETRLFRSAAAGEVVFKKLDLLLLQRDPVYLDLAAVYFFALSLGFKGKFRGNDSQHQLDRYKHQLFAMIFRRNPELLQSRNHIIPQTYLHTLAEGKAQKLPHPRKWLLVFVAILLVWVTVSHVLWRGLTSPVEERLKNVSQVPSEECK